MILKAGTYRFNEVLVDFPTVSLEDIYNTSCVIITEQGLKITYDDTNVVFNQLLAQHTTVSAGAETNNVNAITIDALDSSEGYLYSYQSADNEYKGWQVNTPVYITIVNDITVYDHLDDNNLSEEDIPLCNVLAYNFIIINTNYNEVNAKPLAEITYNGETIAQLNAGETCTIKCAEKRMITDIIVKINT